MFSFGVMVLEMVNGMKSRKLCHEDYQDKLLGHGSPGTYSEISALKAYPMCKTAPCDQIGFVFKAVELWLVDKGVLLIENSVGGSIHQNYDLLLRHRLHIVGEVELVVNHYLLGLTGVRKEELTHVLSDPQALEQCDVMLNKLGIVKVSTEDTAGAASASYRTPVLPPIMEEHQFVLM